MTLSADAYAASFTASLDAYDALRPRSLQREMGVSAIGLCRAQAAYYLDGTAPTDSPPGRQALMGTAVHNVVGEARKNFLPRLLIEQELTVRLPSGLTVLAHADEIDPDEPSVTDYKTVIGYDEMVVLRRKGSTEQQQFQRHLYYAGAMQAGLVPARGVVRNVWVDRSGQSPEPYVEQEAFDPRVVERADQWLTDVAYAVEHGEESLKDKHYDWCARFCRWFSLCRINDKPDLVITDEALVTAAEYVAEGRAMEKEGKALASAGKKVLDVLKPDPGGDVYAYQAGAKRVRWSWVNKAEGAGHFALHVDSLQEN